jgi:hypothetical protein
VLKAHSAIPVTHLANGARVTLGAHTPYVINRASSPSFKRAAQKRPGLLARSAIKRVYDALPTAAKVGKAEPEHVRAMLQGALDAGAVPGQGPGLTEAMLKDFLSDLGVGVDCSGFVCQALKRLMAEAQRGERISTSSGYLRGGGGHNPRAFDLVAAPRDLRPGDTMWKDGHIRIVTRVRAAGDGAVEFTTAESSSVGLIGPVAKEWRCPDAARFAGSQVRRKGAWAPNGETNAYSRYKPLAAALGLGGTTALGRRRWARSPRRYPPPSPRQCPWPSPRRRPSCSPRRRSIGWPASPSATRRRSTRISAGPAAPASPSGSTPSSAARRRSSGRARSSRR